MSEGAEKRNFGDLYRRLTDFLVVLLVLRELTRRIAGRAGSHGCARYLSLRVLPRGEALEAVSLAVVFSALCTSILCTSMLPLPLGNLVFQNRGFFCPELLCGTSFLSLVFFHRVL